jgi:hypothetical protein
MRGWTLGEIEPDKYSLFLNNVPKFLRRVSVLLQSVRQVADHQQEEGAEWGGPVSALPEVRTLHLRVQE